MAEYTSNYNLKKPLKTEYINISDINGNMDILDEKLKAVNDKISQISTGLSETGYAYIGDLLLQWGKEEIDATGAGIKLINFPKSYEAFYNVQLTKVDNSDYTYKYVLPTNTGLQVAYITQTASGASFTVNWFTVGKAVNEEG